MLIDTHAHLYWDSFKSDLDEVVKRSLDTGVTTIINVGVDVHLSQVALGQIENLTKIGLIAYSTIGIHPHESIKYKSNKAQVTSDKLKQDVAELERIYQQNPQKVVGVGECGLDYFFDPEFTPQNLSQEQLKNLQRQLFKAQIELAKKLNLPLIVHCRDDRSKDPQNSEAWDETLELVGNHPTILHCYSGLPPTTNHILQTTNILVSFAATITYPKNEYLREAAKILPLDRIVLETDCPFLPPQTNRGKRNEPSFITETAKAIAQIKGLPAKEVEETTAQNCQKLLQLSKLS